MPGAYRSPRIRPRQVTTTARVIASGGPNPVVMARSNAAESIPEGHGALAITSPMGQGVVAAGGRLGLTTEGVK